MTKEEIKAILDRNANIPTAEIEQDILDTQREIEQMEREAAGFRLIGDRMSVFRADARDDGIRRRKDFIEKLRRILDYRLKARAEGKEAK